MLLARTCIQRRRCCHDTDCPDVGLLSSAGSAQTCASSPQHAQRTTAERAHRLKAFDAEHEAHGIQDVGLAGPIESRDGIELGVELVHNNTFRVRLEAVY